MASASAVSLWAEEGWKQHHYWLNPDQGVGSFIIWVGLMFTCAMTAVATVCSLWDVIFGHTCPLFRDRLAAAYRERLQPLSNAHLMEVVDMLRAHRGTADHWTTFAEAMLRERQSKEAPSA